MKFIALIFVVVAAASAVEQEIFKLSPEAAEKVYKFAIPCAKEHNIDTSLIPRVADGTLPRDDATNKFLYCFTLNAGYITEDGHLVVDKLTNIVKDHPLAGEVRKALTKCNEVTKETPMATLLAMNTCFAEAPPLRFVL